jgi:hypothetical protein
MNFAIRKMCFVVPFGVAAIGLASPAYAFGPSAGSANSSETSRVQSNDIGAPAAAKKQAAAKKYCMTMEAATGSRMTTRECKTKAEWDMLGYEVGEKE